MNNIQSQEVSTDLKQDKKICLCMIVKNESRIISRCLDSAKPIIDYVSICDTGSTDNTREIIEDWCVDNNKSVTIHQEPFINFGYNRSLAVRLAQETYPEVDYLLLLDADMILKVDPNFDKTSLVYDQYLIMQFNEHIEYWNTRLIKASVSWKCIGVTHEYWDIDRPKLETKQNAFFETKGHLDTLVIDDQEDGGCKGDKYERDKQLLLDGIHDPITEPGLKMRYMFYLAQTLYALNDFKEAIKWYKKRVQSGGWAEEVFYSLLQIGLCYEHLANKSTYRREQLARGGGENKLKMEQDSITNIMKEEEQFFALATRYFQDAWEYRPSRAEPLCHLARIFRIQTKHNLGLIYAIKAKEIPFPNDDILFVDYRVYSYLIDYEISICACYIESKRYLGSDAQKRLESKIDDLPKDIALFVLNNSKFY